MQAEGCPHRERLSSYLLGTLSEQEAGHLAHHLESCPRCTSVVEALKVLSDASMAEGGDASGLAETIDSDPPAQGSGIPAVSTADPPEGSTVEAPFLGQLGDYKLLGKLGQGGMGMVYKSLHTKLGRLVALKVLTKQRVLDDRAVTRFQREMMAVGALDHPNIVRATDASEAGGTHFLVMEYVDGLDLAELVQHCGPLKVADACELIRQTALGLACATSTGWSIATSNPRTSC